MNQHTVLGSSDVHRGRVPHHTARRIPSSRLLAVAACIAIPGASLLLSACRGEAPVSINADASNLVWSIKNSTGAATLSPGTTVQLTTTAYTYAGEPVEGLPAATFRSTDSTKVTVSPTGLVTGVAATTSNVNVISSLTVAGVTHADTTIVAVTPVAHTLKTFSIHPASQITTIPLNGNTGVTVTATDSGNQTLTGLAVKLVSSAPLVADFYYGYLYAYAKGQTTVIASTTSFGVTKADTVTYTVTNPMQANVYCYEHAYLPYEPAFYVTSNPIIIGAGGTVTWANYGNMVTGITFDDSTHVTGGNIASIPLYTSASRTFPTTGTYVFKDVLGDSATIVVIPN